MVSLSQAWMVNITEMSLVSSVPVGSGSECHKVETHPLTQGVSR